MEINKEDAVCFCFLLKNNLGYFLLDWLNILLGKIDKIIYSYLCLTEGFVNCIVNPRKNYECIQYIAHLTVGSILTKQSYILSKINKYHHIDTDTF